MSHSDTLFEKANRLKKQGLPFALATVVRAESPTSAKPGAKAIVFPDGQIEGWIGGGCAQPAVINTAKQVLSDGQARLIRVSQTQAPPTQDTPVQDTPAQNTPVEEGIIDFSMTCFSGGTLDIFIEAVLPRPALLIIGASPAAQSLSSLASQLGFAVTTAFPGANTELFPEAVQIVDGFNIALPSPPQFVVVATQGKGDEPGLEAALGTGAEYISFISSARKAEKMRAYLKDKGYDSVRVDRILSPAGIEIGAVTPEEIALSVLAGLVKTRRQQALAEDPPAQRAPSAVSEPRPGRESENAEKPSQEISGATAIDPICGMAVEIGASVFHSDFRGRRYHFCCAGCLHLFEKSPDIYLADMKDAS